LLTLKLTFSLAQIGVNRDFLSLPIESDRFIFSLSNQEIKNKRNEIFDQNGFF